METKPIVYIIVILVALNLIFAGLFLWARLGQVKAEKLTNEQQINEKALIFTKLFVQKVMQGEKEISIDDRLQLENSVRGLNDTKIFSQWQSFTNAKNNQEAQESASRLFILLLDKIKY